MYFGGHLELNDLGWWGQWYADDEKSCMLLVMRVLSIVPLNFTVSLRWTRTLWLNSQLDNRTWSAMVNH